MNAPQRFLVDEIAPQHEYIHHQLDLWGIASRDRKKRWSRSMIERLYRPPNLDGPQPRPEQLAAEQFRALDRAILNLPELHRKLLAEYYVQNAPPHIIKRRLRIHFSHFNKLLFDSRAGVLNQLRRANAPTQDRSPDPAR